MGHPGAVLIPGGAATGPDAVRPRGPDDVVGNSESILNKVERQLACRSQSSNGAHAATAAATANVDRTIVTSGQVGEWVHRTGGQWCRSRTHLGGERWNSVLDDGGSNRPSVFGRTRETEPHQVQHT